MALKSKLPSIDGLPEDVKKEYKKVGEEYVLDVDGIDDHPAVGALKRSMENAKTERKTAQDEARQFKDELTTAQEQLDDMRRGAIPKGDVDALENSWKKKVTDLTTEKDGKIGKLTDAVDKALRQAAAHKLAADVFVNPTVGLPHVLPRLKVVEENDEFVVKVLDNDGKPSASTMEDFQKELLTNKDLAPILRGTRASGGGANGGNGGGGAPSDDKNFDAATASPKDLAARITARKTAEGG